LGFPADRGLPEEKASSKGNSSNGNGDSEIIMERELKYFETTSETTENYFDTNLLLLKREIYKAIIIAMHMPNIPVRIRIPEISYAVFKEGLILYSNFID
jgi:hypothetical protein